MVDRILGDEAESEGELTGTQVVDRALDELSITSLSAETRSALLDFADSQFGPGANGSAHDSGNDSDNEQTPRQRAVNVLKVVGAAPEFQRA